ncbi:hypothetical protein KAU11_03240, partial [Candidatus Babeliales bacterium]|nr:hypothetical protein [Candidatus Babeliales bacterium]
MRKTIKIAAIAGTTTTLALIIFFSLFFAINSLQKTAKNAFDKKHYQKTRNILEELQTENPNNPLLSFNLGVANHKENRFTQAEKHFLRAATLAEKHPDQQFLEPKAYANAGNSKFADATKDLKENLKSKEKVAKAIQELQTAANHCYAALKKEPKNQRVKNNLKAIEDLIEQLKKYLEQIENEPEKAENSRKDIENKLDQNQQDQSQKQDSKKSDSKDSQNQHNPNQQSQQQNSPDQQDQQGENQDQSQQESGQTQEN